jgi:hypothetical protein
MFICLCACKCAYNLIITRFDTSDNTPSLFKLKHVCRTPNNDELFDVYPNKMLTDLDTASSAEYIAAIVSPYLVYTQEKKK